MVRRHARGTDSPATRHLIDEVRDLARPLRTPSDLRPLLDHVGHARVVLLGEASHGTREFYTWRAEVTRRLVEEHGFDFVAVEGDWPDCYQVNQYVKNHPGAATMTGPDVDATHAPAGRAQARAALECFRRWPTWMWANEEVCDLVTWLRRHNDGVPEGRKVGFYGLDVYSLWDSLRAVMRYLRKHQPQSLEAARRAVRCFEPYAEEAQDYARATELVGESCRDEVVNLLYELRAGAKGAAELTGPRNGIEDSGRAGREQDGRDGHFVAEQNALVVKNAEAYYRAMVRSDSGSWNVRDRHMAETLDRLLDHHGPRSRAVVWEHNTHVGDARFTDMADDGMVNLGQLARDRHGRGEVFVVGFGTHRGTVIAGESWGAPWDEMRVPEARPESWEDVLHRAGASDKLLMFGRPASEEMSAWRGHRAIGVVYRPRFEQYGNYVPTVLPERYDAFLHIDQSRGVRPLFEAARELEHEELPETYPTGE
jgi:erythromycin esterase-like protein